MERETESWWYCLSPMIQPHLRSDCSWLFRLQEPINVFSFYKSRFELTFWYMDRKNANNVKCRAVTVCRLEHLGACGLSLRDSDLEHDASLPRQLRICLSGFGCGFLTLFLGSFSKLYSSFLNIYFYLFIWLCQVFSCVQTHSGAK